MRKRVVIGLAGALLAPGLAWGQVELGPADYTFTYQGRLNVSGAPAFGIYDLTFSLLDAADEGTTVAAPVVLEDVPVTAGLFTAPLDFGLSPFAYSGRWLEISVRDGASTGSYTGLSPRVPLTPAPYAIRAIGALDARALWGRTPDDFASSSHTHHGTDIREQTIASTQLGIDIKSLARVSGGTLVAAPGEVTLSGRLHISSGDYKATLAADPASGALVVTSVGAGPDQQQLLGDYWSTSPRGQSFTVGRSGRLTAIGISAIFQDPQTVTMTLHQGQGFGGAAVTSASVTVTAANSDVLFTFPTPVRVTAGQVYTLSLRSTSESFFARYAHPDSYAGGTLHHNDGTGDSDLDLYFRTFVSAGSVDGALQVDGAVHATAGGFRMPDGSLLTSMGESGTSTAAARADHRHDGTYALAVHNHDATYSPITHNHNSTYSPVGHNHDSAYSPVAHNHDAAYAKTVHAHSSLSASDGTPAQAVTVDAAGAVGIGTASPAAPLDVRGRAAVQSALEFTTGSQGEVAAALRYDAVDGSLHLGTYGIGIDQKLENASNVSGTIAGWQSFTAGTSGLLHRVELYRNANAPAATLRVRQGTGTGGALLATQAVPATPALAGWQTIDLAVLVSLSAASVYTIELTAPTAILWRYLPADGYPGGTCETAGLDRGFRTWMAGSQAHVSVAAGSGDVTLRGQLQTTTVSLTAPAGDPSPVIVSRTVPADQGGSNEKSELLLFNGNDPENGAGPDLITLRAPAIRLQTYSNTSVNTPDHAAGSNDRLTIDPAGHVTVGQNLTVVGQAYKTGGGSWATPSDASLKKNVSTISGALEKLLQLRGVRYQWKNPELDARTGPLMGMIADEVENVFPEWIKRAPDGTRLLEVQGFEGLTVEALKELKTENNALRRENSELRERVADLESQLRRLDEMESRLRRLEEK